MEIREYSWQTQIPTSEAMKALLYIAMCPSPLNQRSYPDRVPQIRAISVIV